MVKDCNSSFANPNRCSNLIRRRLILFAKTPIVGQVKTRLIPAIGKHKATEIYTYLLKRTIDIAEQLPAVEKYLFVSDGEGSRFPDQFFDQFSNWSVMPQRGNDIGHRQQNALEETVVAGVATVLIGADIMDCTSADLNNAFQVLEQGFDSVIGPSVDGGYWLVGSGGKSLPIFSDITWSSARVFSQTRARLQRYGLSYHCITERRDLDEISDLKRLNLLAEGPPLAAIVVAD